MIDTGNIERHYIVKKEDEVTTVEVARDSNVADEEVLYNALGFSLFEILKQKNIIFEGWRDKRLFAVGQSKAPAATKKILKELGVCHAKGVKHIKTITPLIELARRSCIILSDSDKPAKDQRKQFKAEKGFGEWKLYQDIAPELTAVTGEDFLKNSAIASAVTAAVANSGLPAFLAGECPESGKLGAIEAWLRARGLNAEQTQDTISAVKTSLFERLAAKDIEDSYVTYLDGIANAAEELK
jgi:hypothetical protein